jgi:hypothetical protein
VTLRSLILGLYLTAAGCHSPQAPGPATATPLFREAAAETGLVFRHFTGATGQFYLPEIMGPGAAVFDYDGDGDLDVYFTQGVVLEPGKSVPGQPLGNRLFRNELRPSGRLRFADVTQQARVGYAGYGMGIAVGDYDNDGRPDLLVTCLGSIVLYRNSGDGTFADVTGPAGLADALWATSAAFLDYDRDGDLDLFVTHYVDFTVAGNKRCPGLGGELDYCSPAAYRGVPDRLYRNDGHGRFTDVTANSGVGSKPGPGLGVVCADFDGDGWLDIYVANDGAANHLWLNQRNGTFRENAVTAGVAYSMDGKAQAGMGVDAEDFDDDGDTDIFVTNLTAETNSLYVNDGKGLFTDDVVKFGLMPPSLPYTGFGTGWLDYDHDGRLDLFVANGAVKIVESLRGAPYPYHESNQLFHHEGARYRETTAEAGPAFQLSEVSRAAAFGDIDNDGDIDIVLGNNNGPARLLLNEAAEGGSLEVALDGISSNRLGLGALVGVLLPGGKTVWRRARTDGSYLSANDPRVHFGLDGAAKLDGVVVVWPNGKAEKWTGIRPGALVRLREGAGTVWNPR